MNTIPCLIRLSREMLQVTPRSDKQSSTAKPSHLPGLLAAKLIRTADKGERWIELTAKEIADFRAASMSQDEEGW